MSQTTVGLTDPFVDLQHSTDGTDTASSAQEYSQAYIEVGNEGKCRDDDPQEDDDTANNTHGPMRQPFLQSTIQICEVMTLVTDRVTYLAAGVDITENRV